MAERILLGNVKGEKGDKGDTGLTGKDGGFNGEKIGLINILDINTVVPFSGNVTNLDIENGVIEYSNMTYALQFYIKMGSKKYKFKMSDYTVFTSYPVYPLVQVRALDGTTLFSSGNISKNEPIEIDFTDQVEQDVIFRIQCASSVVRTGFIEKPMLYDSDYSVEWSPSLNDVKDSLGRGLLIARFNTTQVESGVATKLTNAVSINNRSDVEILNGEFKLKKGVWLFDIGLDLDVLGSTDGVLTTHLFKNDLIVTSNIKNVNGLYNTLKLTGVMYVENDDDVIYVQFRHTTGKTINLKQSLQSLINFKYLGK